MNKKTITKFVNIKQVLFEKEGGEEKYNKLFDMCKTSDDLIDTLLTMGYTMIQAVLLVDIILLERAKAEETLYKSMLTSTKASTTVN